MLYTLRRTYGQLKAFFRAYRYSFLDVFKIDASSKNPVQVARQKLLSSSVHYSGPRRISTKYGFIRQMLIDNVVKRVTYHVTTNFRKRSAHSAQQMFYGHSRFFALVGVNIASKAGILREVDHEGICRKIRDSIFSLRRNLLKFEDNDMEEFSLDSLEFGRVIATGCNAVVYEARKKINTDPASIQSLGENSKRNYPLAVKMMFNYHAESNATSILRSMYREMIPMFNTLPNPKKFWERDASDRIQKLPPHINIVKMYQAFPANIPELPDSKTLYPDALPQRINPSGYGRNMTLFLVMKKYDTDLKRYLVNRQVDIRDGVLLFSQLLEAVSHIRKYSIAHRDLKTDNILLEFIDEENACPSLVVTDFGCCLADRYFGLNLPYRSPDVDKGGNPALMAPEVITAKWGMFSSINYNKSDLWTVGTIAYEIFTKKNPFYHYIDKKDEEVLRSATYTENMLPSLPNEVPALISNLIRAILIRNPADRMDAETAATVCQLYLWAPNQWLIGHKLPSNNEILDWLLSLTTRVLYESNLLLKTSQKKITSTVEYQLIVIFLQRVKLNVIRRALDWICEI